MKSSDLSERVSVYVCVSERGKASACVCARACARVRVCAHVYISKYLGGFFHAREKMNIGMIIT